MTWQFLNRVLHYNKPLIIQIKEEKKMAILDKFSLEGKVALVTGASY